MPRTALAIAASAALIAGCAADPARPPVARIAAAPTAVLAHDGFQTDVTLDGTASVAVEDPGAKLRFQWDLLDDEARTDANLHEPMIAARFRGERAPRVVLTVTDPDGRTGSVELPIALTLPAGPP